MIEFNEALELIKANAILLPTEKIPFNKSLNRVTATDTFYDVDLPPFDKSAMDGYACRMEDINNKLEVVEVIHAGKQPEKAIGKNQCAKIMTGAVVPLGADCVIMKEHIEEIAENKIICPSGKSKPNICYKGEDVNTGDLAIRKHTLITPRHIPILAGAGAHMIEVYKLPEITVFATGSELVEPSEKPLPHQIRNSNSSQMLTQFQEIGVNANYGGIVKDSLEETENKLAKALETSDILIMSGGVSVGDFDFIPTVIEKLGFEIKLTRSAIQPGKPIVFAQKGNKYCFGLAGNPASSFLQLEIYFKPFFYKLMGYDYPMKTGKATLTQNFTRRKTARMLFTPSYIDESQNVTPVNYNGSAHIHALMNANCFLMIPIGVAQLKEGEEVNVRFI